MVIKEITNLSVGVYLLTDRNCINQYLLFRYEKEEGLLCHIFHRQTYVNTFSESIAVFFYKEIEREESNVRSLISLGGITFHNDFRHKLSELHLIGEYNEKNFLKDLANFLLHHMINIPEHDKKNLYDFNKNIFNNMKKIQKQ